MKIERTDQKWGEIIPEWQVPSKKHFGIYRQKPTWAENQNVRFAGQLHENYIYTH